MIIQARDVSGLSSSTDGEKWSETSAFSDVFKMEFERKGRTENYASECLS